MDLDVITVASFASGPSGLVQKVATMGVAGQRPFSTKSRNDVRNMHQMSTLTLHFVVPLPLTNSGGLARPGVEVEMLSGVGRQIEPAGNETCFGNHVRVRRAPCDGAIGAQRDRLEFGLKDDVIEAR